MTTCADFSWDDKRDQDSARTDYAIGDLVWNPKDPGAHLLTHESKPVQYGWEDPWTYPECECGQIDMLDHHVFMLRKAADTDSQQAGTT